MNIIIVLLLIVAGLFLCHGLSYLNSYEANQLASRKFDFQVITALVAVAVALKLLSVWLKRREDRHKQEKQADERRTAEQSAIRSDLLRLVDDSTKIARAMPALVQSAENALATAEYEFKERAFIPFWDAIEVAAIKLATLEASNKQIVRNAEKHRNQIVSLDAPRPKFELQTDSLPDGVDAAERMRAIVRPALKDADFTKIYLLCRQNKILVAGFSTLGETINELGNRLETSASEIHGELEKTRKFLEEDSLRRREHESEQREMLDNIQRRTKPRR